MGKTSELFIEIRQKIQESVNQVIEGEINPFELGRELTYTKIVLQKAKDQISDAEKEEFQKYSKEELKEMRIQLAGGGYTWKFDHIQEWKELKDKLTDIEEKAKNAFYASIKNSTFFDNETGSEITPADGKAKKQSVSYK